MLIAIKAICFLRNSETFMTKDKDNGKPENEAGFCGLYTVPQHPQALLLTGEQQRSHSGVALAATG